MRGAGVRKGGRVEWREAGREGGGRVRIEEKKENH